MLKVFLFHESFGPLGGIEKIAAHMTNALRLSGFHVEIYTSYSENLNRVKDLFHVELPQKSRGLLPRAYPRFIIKKWLRPITSNLPVSLMLKAKSKGYDLVINATGIGHGWAADIVYCNGLQLARSPVRKAYQILNTFIAWPFHKNSQKILSNSKFTGYTLQSCLGIQSEVLSPPVESKILSERARGTSKKNQIITVGRFERNRNNHLILTIARLVKRDCRFVIAGSVGEPGVVVWLARKIREYGLKDKVSLQCNVPRSGDGLFKLLAESKIYLGHPYYSESFGLAVAEGMAAGAVPVVYKAGAQWLDLLACQQGKYGFAYENFEEAAHYIDMLLSNHRVWEELSSNAMHKAAGYDEKVFAERFVELCITACRNKN